MSLRMEQGVCFTGSLGEMSAFGISGIGPSFGASMVNSRNYSNHLSLAQSGVKTSGAKGSDNVTLSSAGSNALQEAYSDNMVVQMALDSARAVMEKMSFITDLLDDIEKDGFDTNWIGNFMERLNGDTKTEFGGKVVEDESFLETLLEELHKEGSDTSWVTNLIQVLNNQVDQDFGTIVSQSIFLKEKNAPLKPIIEASVLFEGRDYENIDSNKFSLDLNATNKHDVKSAADAFIKKLEERMAQLKSYTKEVHSGFESVAQEILGSGASMSPETITQVASEVGLQIQQGGLDAGSVHGNVSATRTLALIK